MKLFDASILLCDLSVLGSDEDSYARFVDFVSMPNGLILVTDPHGFRKDHHPLLQVQIRQLAEGETSFDEVIRVTVENGD